jgi:NADH-quinone oxidoreductase subunit E
MSVRRLDPDQPASFEFTPENLTWAKEQIGKYPEGRHWAAVIPLLWRAQEQHDGWLPEPAIRAVSELLDMPYIRVYEVATFYTMFNLSPVGKYFVQICGTTPCMLRGSEELKDILRRMMQINKDYFEDLTPDSLTTLLNKLKTGVGVKPGPQSNRQFSAPASGMRTLLDTGA